MVKNNFQQYFVACESNPFIFCIFTFYCLGFYELCAWTRPKSWVPHSKSYGTSVSDWRCRGILHIKIFLLPNINTLTFSRRKGKHGIHAFSEKGVSCSHSKRVYIGQGIAWGTRMSLEESVLYGHSHPRGIFNSGEHLSLSIIVDVYIAPLCGAWTWLALSGQKKMLCHHFRKQANAFKHFSKQRMNFWVKILLIVLN